MDKKETGKRKGFTMAKKQIILLGVAALFAVSGVVALPSGNVTGGVEMCIRDRYHAAYGLWDTAQNVTRREWYI